MPDPRLLALSLTEVAALVQRKEVSPVELAEAVLTAIDELNPRLNAFTTLVPAETVRTEARTAEREILAGTYRGPVHGIPVSVKDLIDTAGLRTTYGSGMFKEHVPAVDGAMPARLRAAGAILVGKTATHEFGKGVTTNNYFYGPTRNPWNLEHVPGGSSGGAASATAARLGPLHVGTDGGGSVRFPAAFCGVVALKPTIGLLSNRGHTGGGDSSFSVPGPLTRSVRDAAVAAQLLAGFDPGYVYSRPGPVPDLIADLDKGVRGFRVGTMRSTLQPAPSPDVAAAHEATLARLEELGARLVDVELPHHELVLPAVVSVFGLEADTLLELMLGDRPRVFSPQVARIIENRPSGNGIDWVRAQQTRQRIRQDYEAAFNEADVLVAPVAPVVAPRIESDENAYVAQFVPYCGAANLVGFPGVALPAGLSRGLPIGMQILAPAGADARALRVAYALEAAYAVHRVATPPNAA